MLFRSTLALLTLTAASIGSVSPLLAQALDARTTPTVGAGVRSEGLSRGFSAAESSGAGVFLFAGTPPAGVDPSGGPWTPPASHADTTATPLDLRVARIARSPRYRESAFLRESATITGLAAFPGTLLLAGVLYGAGEAREDGEMRELGLHLGTASTAAIGSTVAIKVVVGRARPDVSPEAPNDVKLWRGFRGNDYQSFPSAHTATAFAAATVLTAQLGAEGSARFWVPPTAYGLATLAGLSRIYDDEHWFTDIVAGALVGLASGVLTVQLVEN